MSFTLGIYAQEISEELVGVMSGKPLSDKMRKSLGNLERFFREDMPEVLEQEGLSYHHSVDPICDVLDGFPLTSIGVKGYDYSEPYKVMARLIKLVSESPQSHLNHVSVLTNFFERLSDRVMWVTHNPESARNRGDEELAILNSRAEEGHRVTI